MCLHLLFLFVCRHEGVFFFGKVRSVELVAFQFAHLDISFVRRLMIGKMTHGVTFPLLRPFFLNFVPVYALHVVKDPGRGAVSVPGDP